MSWPACGRAPSWARPPWPASRQASRPAPRRTAARSAKRSVDREWRGGDPRVTNTAGLGSARMWDIGLVAQIDPTADALVGDWLSLPEVAERLGIPSSRVKQLL